MLVATHFSCFPAAVLCLGWSLVLAYYLAGQRSDREKGSQLSHLSLSFSSTELVNVLRPGRGRIN